MSKNKQAAFISCNVSIVVMEIWALALRLSKYEEATFLYYTVISNVIAMVVCTLSVIWAIKNKYRPSLYLWSTCLISFTLMVMLVGANSVEGGYFAMFCEGACLINHLACPLLMIFVYFALLPKDVDEGGSWLAVLFTLCYGTAMYLLNAFRVIQGPYFFFEVHKMGLGKTLAYLFTLVALSFLTSFTLYALKMATPKGNLKKSKPVAK